MSIKVLFSLLLAGSVSLSLCAQFPNVILPEGDSFAFVKAYIMNTDNSPYVGEVVFQGEKPYHRVVVHTDKTGWCKAKVPISDTYTLYCEREEPAFRKAKVGDFPFVTSELRTYTHRFVRFKFLYQNESGRPIPNEEVVISSEKTGKQYIDTTNANGIVIVDLPFDPAFRASVKYFDNVRRLEVRDVNKEYKVMEMTFTWMGSAEKQRREALADSLAREAHAAAKIRIDSLLKLGKTFDTDAEPFIPISCGDIPWAISALQQKAAAYKKQLAQNAKFFQERKKTVLAALYRLNSKYKQKIIVTDITGSMSPYMEEVLLWHALNFTEGLSTKYVFFNDGDKKPTSSKKIGETGGLYFCQGQIKDFSVIIETMRKGVSGGDGGDGPENDIEALLLAIQKRSERDELILIADNFSTMRDYKLLNKIKIPVRVIVCGLENSSLWQDVDIEYLDLAYRTGGSLHTLNEDIYHLKEIVEGGTLRIEGIEYILEGGKFRRHKKS